MVEKLDMRNVILAPLLAATILLVSFALAPVYGQPNNRAQVQVIPLDVLIDNLDCGGELISATGTMHIVSQVIADESGRFHSIGHINLAQMSGVGVNSGTQYRLTNSGIFVFNLNAGSQDTQVSGFRLIATGPDGSTVDLMVHAMFHVTFNANGELTAQVTDFRTVCA